MVSLASGPSEKLPGVLAPACRIDQVNFGWRISDFELPAEVGHLARFAQAPARRVKSGEGPTGRSPAPPEEVGHPNGASEPPALLPVLSSFPRIPAIQLQLDHGSLYS